MRYRVIQEHDRRYPIRLMCRALAVSPAGYYAWRGTARESAGGRHSDAPAHHPRAPSGQSPDLRQSEHLAGARKQGHRVGEHRVARLMRHDGLRAKTVKKWRATTHSSHRLARGSEHA